MGELPDIDLSKIDFPSDGLTIKVLRQLAPDYFDTELASVSNLYTRTSAKYEKENPLMAATLMLAGERQVAEAAFLKGQGVQCDPEYLEDAEHCGKLAAEMYVRFGIAKGPHHAEQLLRDVESQAGSDNHRNRESG